MKRNNSYLIGNQFAKGHKPNCTIFKKEHIPWNKGLKGIHLSPVSEFKKGHNRTRAKEIGNITMRKDKNGVFRWWIKVANPHTWVEYAKWFWIQHFGPLPKNCVVHHADKDSLNDTLKNLTLLTRCEHINTHRQELRGGLKEQLSAMEPSN